QARPIDQVRSFYEKLVTQFPNAGRYWKAYIDHECVDTIADGACWAKLREIKTNLGDRLECFVVASLYFVAFRMRSPSLMNKIFSRVQLWPPLAIVLNETNKFSMIMLAFFGSTHSSTFTYTVFYSICNWITRLH
ncbi:hypothetical protein Tcan_01339, partial [Toxocara canis]